MIFDENDDGDIDMKDLDIDEDNMPHTGQHSRRRELLEDQQSSYSSHLGGSSSEATIDSDLLMTYQQAVRQHGAPTSGGPGSSQEAGMLMYQKSTNRPFPQDKSPIKVPTLNFGKM